jgi:hypothetical protein
VNEQTIIVRLTPDVLALLHDNGLDLLSELRKQGLAVKRSTRPEALELPESGAKSVELIILASAAAAPLVASAITRIIDAIGRNKRATVTQVAVDTSGAYDGTGKPRQPSQTQSSTKISLMGLTVELNDNYS